MVSENTKLINEVLGRTDLIDADVVCIADDWRAFCNDPEKYRNTVVVDMVNQYIEEELYEEVDYGYEMNMPCDTYGPCACSSSCPNYIQCQG